MFRTALAVLLALSAAAPVAAQSPSKDADAILVLDASGSMWGLVEGQTKMSAARTAVGAIIDKWNPDHRLGVMAYGHRSKGDCSDIEMVQPIGAVDGAAIRATVAKLNPMGKTPISASLRMAAEELKSSENASTVILVSDGIETCNADPCAVAAQLKKSGVNFVAHVIGFDVTDPVAKAQLQCVARNTGGVYLDAKNAGGLEDALGKAVEAAQGAKVESEAPAQESRQDPFAGKNWRGVVRLGEGLDPLMDADQNVSWSLYEQQADGSAGQFVQLAYGSPMADTAKPGKYLVKVVLMQTEREVPVTITAKPATQDIILNAGYVTSEGAIAGSGAKVENVTWEVYTADGKYLAASYDPVPRFVLPAGDYVLKLAKDSAKSEKPFTVAAGDNLNLAMTLDAGKLVANATFTAQGPEAKDNLTFEIYKPISEAGGKPEWLATKYDAQSVFELPAGSYELVTTLDSAVARQPIKVVSGKTEAITIDLKAGILALEAPGAETVEIFTTKKDLYGKRELVYTSYDPSLNRAFTAGEYIVRVTRAGTPKDLPVVVKAGERGEFTAAP